MSDRVTVLVGLLSDTIRDLKEVPSGHLYAAMTSLIPEEYDLDLHMDILNAMEEAGLVKVENHLVKWVGP